MTAPRALVAGALIEHSYHFRSHQQSKRSLLHAGHAVRSATVSLALAYLTTRSLVTPGTAPLISLRQGVALYQRSAAQEALSSAATGMPPMQQWTAQMASDFGTEAFFRAYIVSGLGFVTHALPDTAAALPTICELPFLQNVDPKLVSAVAIAGATAAVFNHAARKYSHLVDQRDNPGSMLALLTHGAARDTHVNAGDVLDRWLSGEAVSGAELFSSSQASHRSVGAIGGARGSTWGQRERKRPGGWVRALQRPMLAHLERARSPQSISCSLLATRCARRWSWHGCTWR